MPIPGHIDSAENGRGNPISRIFVFQPISQRISVGRAAVLHLRQDAQQYKDDGERCMRDQIHTCSIEEAVVNWLSSAPKVF